MYVLVIASVLFANKDIEKTISGEITVNKQVFTYTKSINNVNVISSDKRIVFHSESTSDYEIILNVGYSTNLKSFYVFKHQLDVNTKKNSLLLETESNKYLIAANFDTAFYSPILVDTNSLYILFITENFTLSIFDFQIGKIIKQICSNVPIFKLQKIKIKNKFKIEYSTFNQNKYVTKNIELENLLYTDNLKILSQEKNIENEETLFIKKLKSRAILLSLNYKKFLCFGDSITYGYINKEPAQELGYVPRLYKMITDNLYDAYLINEGYPGTLTHEAVDIFDNVIKNHNAKYLLFHYGTNDAIHTEIPVSNVIYNIKYMVEASVRYGMYPIISTLIPRNGWTGIGILRNRAMQINEGIRELSESLQIPIIDFWDLFSLFPDEEGGYLSLMSDNVHPSENGYQLMALNWYEHIKNIAPSIPTNIHTVAKTGTEIKLAWDDNIAEDFSHWVIEFSFFNKNFGYSYTTTINSYEFKINPFSNGILYFRIKAVNNNQVSSEFSDIIEIKLRD